MTPQHLDASLAACQHPCQHEQQIGEAVEITGDLGAHALRSCERPYTTLGAARDGPGQMAGCRGGASAGEDELLERRQAVVEIVERALQASHVLSRDGSMAGDAKLTAEVEELMLHLGQAGGYCRWELGRGEKHADGTVELIDGTEGFHP